MTRQRPSLRIALLLICGLVLSFPGAASAAGLILYEIGTYDASLASAGWAARANDAATLFTNPAGLSRLQGSDLVFGGQLLYGDVRFTPDANTTTPGNDGGNPIGALPGGGIFYAQRLNDDWSAGIGAFSYFGLSQKFDEGWVGRYYLQKATLIGLTVMPSVSYRVNDHVSLGAGLNTMFGFLEQEMAVRNVPAAADGRLKLSANTTGYGANVGGLLEVTEASRFGVTYVSEVSLDFEDTPEFSGLTPLTQAALQRLGVLDVKLGLGMKVPQMVMASFRHEFTPAFALSGNVGWQNWKQFGRVEVAVGDTASPLTVDANYKDTRHGALGAEWVASPSWLVTGGIAYDGAPVSDEDRTISFAVGETWRFAAGARHQVNDAVTVGLGYSLAWGGNVSLDQQRGLLAGRLSGEIQGSALHFFVLTLQWSRNPTSG